MTTIVERGTGGIDVRDLAQFTKGLRVAAPAVARNLRRDLRAVGEIVASEAREIARESSTTIPPTIKVRTAGAGVAVIAGGPDVRIAGLFELGNSRGGRKSASASDKGVFRHPVYGNPDVWVDQPMHPFLAPAVKRSMPEVQEAAVKAFESAIASVTSIGETTGGHYGAF